MLRRMTAALIVLAAAVAPVSAQIALTQVATGFSSPLALMGAPNAPDANQAYVLERGGLVRSLNLSNGAIGSTFLNLNTALTATGGGTLLQNGEEGLLGMAFNPTYTASGNGFLYVNYIGSTPSGNSAGETRIDRFTVNGGVLDQNSRANILTIVQPAGQTNHKGGWLGFSPVDNFLYVATGDGGGGNDPGNRGQDNTQLLGKLLRINPNTTGTGYTLPPSQAAPNPPIFGAGTQREIFATGLRNPFRASFDRLNGNLFIGDVGQGAREEIDFIAAGSPGGQNFGWVLREGRIATPGAGGAPPPNNTEPIYDYGRSLGSTVTGGFVYRGGDILDNGQSLDGTYIFGDYGSGRIFSFRYDGVNGIPTDTAAVRTQTSGFNIAAFGEDNLGRMYALGLSSGQIFRITGQPIPEPGTLVLCGATVLGGWLWRRKRGTKNDE